MYCYKFYMQVGYESILILSFFSFLFQSISQKTPVHTPTVTRFYLIREHRLHGIVTGIEGIKTVSSLDDNLDRLLVSFKDAKVKQYLD